jgi:hypothetical protein
VAKVSKKKRQKTKLSKKMAKLKTKESKNVAKLSLKKGGGRWQEEYMATFTSIVGLFYLYSRSVLPEVPRDMATH